MNTTFPGITLQGITVRASNKNPSIYPETWQAFLQAHTNKGQTLYGVYSKYESDFTGLFNFSVACEKGQGNDTVVLPAGNYFVIDTGTQNPAEIFPTWQKIWKSSIPRTYQTDFEVYASGETIKIYLSI